MERGKGLKMHLSVYDAGAPDVALCFAIVSHLGYAEAAD